MDTRFKIVIFSNQNGLNSDKKVKGFQYKIESILRQVNSPILVMAAMKKDKYRKPMTGMWEWLEQNNDGVSIDKSQSFYVGDAAGRDDGWKPKYKKDHSCGDRKFADNINIAFHTPEEFFLKEAMAEFQWRGFNAKEHVASLCMYSLRMEQTCRLMFPYSAVAYTRVNTISQGRRERSDCLCRISCKWKE